MALCGEWSLSFALCLLVSVEGCHAEASVEGRQARASVEGSHAEASVEGRQAQASAEFLLILERSLLYPFLPLLLQEFCPDFQCLPLGHQR